MTVKRLTSFDAKLIDELTRVEAEAFDDGGLDRWTFPVLIRHGAVYVLECDNGVCGVADVVRDWADNGLAFLVNFAIERGERGKGLGPRFLSEVVRALSKGGIRKVQLTVDPNNEPAMRMYHKAGFKPIAQLPDEYGPGFDRVLLELEVKE